MQQDKLGGAMALALMWAAFTGSAQAEPTRPIDAAVPIDEAFYHAAAVMREAKLPGELVLTDVTGPERSIAFGIADRATKTPNKVGQPWVWASVTKQVTATLVMQEVDRGTITLDDLVGRYLPDFGGNQAITIRELLQHRSGLPNPSADETSDFYRETGPTITDLGRTSGFCAGPPRRPNGGEWEYNNCDYLVLGAILQAVTGLDYDALLEERITTPLGLQSMRLAPDGVAAGGTAARGYIGTEQVEQINVAAGGAAAALTGTASELASFDRALMAGSLLSPTSREVAWSGDPKLGYMALGVWAFDARLAGCSDPIKLIERRGDFGGTQVRNVIAPSLGRALVLFTNDASADFGEIWQGKGLSYDLLSAAFCPAQIGD